MRRQPHVRRWWAAMADRWGETVGTIAAVAMVAVAVWWMWPERNDDDATADEAAAVQAAAITTLSLPRTTTTTTAAPEWPPWCGRYVALHVANDVYDDVFDAHAAAYDPEHDAVRAAYDEAWAKAESVYNAYRATVTESEEAFDATVTEEAFDEWARALDTRIAASEAREDLTSKSEAEHIAVVEAARAYVAASLVYADGYSDEYAAAVEAVRSYDAASAALDEVLSAYDEAQSAYEEAQSAYEEAWDDYYAGKDDAWLGRRFDARGHHYDAYRAGWDESHDAQASGNLLPAVEFDPPALARYSAAVDAAHGRWPDSSSLGRALVERRESWMYLDPAVKALNRAAVAALWAAVPEGMDWPDVVQACEG